MKNKTLITLLLALFIASVTCLSGVYAQNIFQRWQEENNPKYLDNLEKSWEKKSTEFLLKQLRSSNLFYSGTANSILLKRKEKRAIPIWLDVAVNSRSGQASTSAFYCLGKIDDPSVIEPLVKIVTAGRANRDYSNALFTLADMKYEKIYPEILRMADDGYQISAVITMLEYFPDKPETLPTLQKIAKMYPRQRYSAEYTIKKIKAR